MNNEIIGDSMFENICDKLKLGKLIYLSVINGGITNKMYKVITDRGIFAVKIINTKRLIDRDKLLERIEISEKIANAALENGVNAVCALKFGDKYIQKIDDFYVLVYNWIDGRIKLTTEINLEDVKVVAREQALLHKIDINNYFFDKNSKKYEFNDYQKYYDLLKDKNEDYLIFFKEKYNELIKIYENIYKNYLKLDEKVVFSHMDLNRKNIIWNGDIPYIIDWETAVLNNPSIDFFNSIWFLSNDVQKDKYYEYAKEYLKVMHINIENGVYAGIIEECNWLYFSLARIFSNDENEARLGMESIQSSLTEIINYYNKIPLMLKVLKNI